MLCLREFTHGELHLHLVHRSGQQQFFGQQGQAVGLALSTVVENQFASRRVHGQHCGQQEGPVFVEVGTDQDPFLHQGAKDRGNLDFGIQQVLTVFFRLFDFELQCLNIRVFHCPSRNRLEQAV
ncbi:MAG: hypothetical protein CAPSK01_003772 [Candidatus Accumulibacter vicinus]|uniref:Uncharacterized protein n=1 Tax=Candidatus Accumulibacter vicinus TaxID=2954382 RepID=A0A084XWI9_9PROT|nr:MAG: hypothetical protein CAPSK01_003772 [Candidatus Accumulibacter vicinus]